MRQVLEKMALRMRNATVYKAYATWEENASEMKHLAAVAVKVVLRWQNQVASKMFMSWDEKWRESKRLRRVADKVVKLWTHSTMFGAWCSWLELVEESQKRLESSTSDAKDEEMRTQISGLASQVDNLGRDLGESKERENQLSKKLAASWKEVSNLGKECEAWRAGGEKQENAMVESKRLLQESLALLRTSEQKEMVLEQQLIDVQATAFEVSSQLVMSDREILRARKELSRARAGEAKALQDAENLLDKVRTLEIEQKSGLVVLTQDMNIVQKMSRVSLNGETL